MRTAGADPRGDTFDINCNNGETYSIVTNGNVGFTAAHDANSNATIVPVSFGPFTRTVTDADGNVVESFTEPGSSKGQSAKGVKNPVTCSFSFIEVGEGLTPTSGRLHLCGERHRRREDHPSR